ncbi:hypothetical protein [Desulfovibrio oxyclinae]|uniref:hypothetical protein n=1 Tax=Desulfovibrio oxyclinae TaxID=63560 RepID=UPI00037569B4|nr:hypothetical protein [Desulfovibrio oxyclinae]
MPKYEMETLEATPEFDLFMFAELTGETRIDQELLDEFAPRWDDWVKKLNAYKLTNTEGENGYILVFLDADVDEEIDYIWNDSPAFALSFHNLAVCMVMTAARGLVPELEQGACAPLPRAPEGVKDATGELGIEWKDDNTINRKYAVFTPFPYSGGCAVCTMSESCPNSTVRQ